VSVSWALNESKGKDRVALLTFSLIIGLWTSLAPPSRKLSNAMKLAENYLKVALFDLWGLFFLAFGHALSTSEMLNRRVKVIDGDLSFIPSPIDN